MKRAYPNLRTWRLDQRPQLTQRQAAKKLGISQAYLSLIETGMQHPRPQLAKKITDVTGVPLETLLGIAS